MRDIRWLTVLAAALLLAGIALLAWGLATPDPLEATPKLLAALGLSVSALVLTMMAGMDEE